MTETLMSAVTTGAFALIAAFLASDWFKQRTNRRTRWVLKAIFAGVTKTYHKRAKELKTDELGRKRKITEPEAQNLRQEARLVAQEIGRDLGVNVAKETKSQFVLDNLIEEAVAAHKRKGAVQS